MAGGPLKVFVSHTSELGRLPVRRPYVTAAEDAIRKLGHQPVSMQYFSAEDRPAADVCVREVRGSQVYIAIIGFRYGSPVSDRPELSYTELEFETATDHAVHRLVFMLDEHTVVGTRDFLYDEVNDARQMAFRRRLRETSGLVLRMVSDAASLEASVLQAFHKLPPSVYQAGEAAPVRGAASPAPSSPPGEYLMSPARYGLLDPGAVDSFRSMLRPDNAELLPRGEEPLLGLGRMNLLVDGRLSLAGVLLFGVNPQADLPVAEIDCAHYLGSDKAAPQPPLKVAGTVRSQFDGAYEFLRTRAAQSARSPSAGTSGAPDVTFPWACVREVLVNAIVHRDYADTARTVTVHLFAERIEISSPGDWYAKRIGRHGADFSQLISNSVKRNPVLARAMYLARYFDGQGSGVEKAISNSAALGIRIPTVRYDAGYVVVTIYRRPAVDGDQPRAATSPRDTPAPASPESRPSEPRLTEAFRAVPAAVGRTGDPASPVDWLPNRGERVVERPELIARLAEELLGPDDEVVAIHGGGGFGKTTLATMVCRERRVLSRFVDGVLWADIGEDLAGVRLADRINGLALRLGATGAGPADPMQAGMRLGELLGDQRLLLVIDDVWHPDQLAPFLQGGELCRRLVTTRDLGVLPLASAAVTVDVMEPGQAERLMIHAVPGLDAGWAGRLARRCGCWPVLLRLVAGQLQSLVRAGVPLPSACEEVSNGLDEEGLDAFDDPGRDRAVATTVEASLRRLGEADIAEGAYERYLDFAVFQPGEPIQRELLAALWTRTAGWRAAQTNQFCLRLIELSLVYADPEDATAIRLHDVMHRYIRERLGARLPLAHARLLEARAASLPREDGRPAWWLLPAEERYLWDYLAIHLREAGDEAALAALIRDLRWVCAKIQHVGPVSVEADLALFPTDPAAQALAQLVRQTANLRQPTDTLDTAVATLAVYAAGVAPLADSARAAFARLPARSLRPALPPLPDQPDAALIRTLRGPAGYASTLAVAADGSWLASGGGGDIAGGGDDRIRIWHPRTRVERDPAISHDGGVSALAAAPDGSWLASAGRDGVVRVWDAVTWRSRCVLTGHSARVSALVVGPAGSWLASGSIDGSARLWDPSTGAETRRLDGGSSWISVLCAAADGSWLASGAGDGTVRIWKPSTGACTAVLPGHAGWVSALAGSPDGSWLASGSGDGTIRVWDAAAGAQRSDFAAHAGPVTALAAAPDGSWLASGGVDGTVRLWNSGNGTPRTVLGGGSGPVTALVAAPDGSWLGWAAADGIVRLADLAHGRVRALAAGHPRDGYALAVAPDGSWVASAGGDGTVRIWDVAAAGGQHASPVGRIGGVFALGAPRSGSWLGVAADDGTVRVWDPMAGKEIARLRGQPGRVPALAAAPDGRWLAIADESGRARFWAPRALGPGLSSRNPAAPAPRGAALAGTTPAPASRAAAPTVLLAAPSGQWLASGGADASVRIWRPTTGTELATLTGHTRGVLALAMPTDESWLASAGIDTTVRFWRPAAWSGSPAERAGAGGRALHGHTSRVLALAAAPDGAWLASAGIDGTIRVWDVAAGEAWAVLDADLAQVSALEVAPDGSWIASGEADGTVRIWNPVTDRQEACLPGGGAVRALRVSPDGSRIACVGGDHVIRVWTPAVDAVATVRLDGALHACAWTSPARLVVGGSRGVYLFDVV